MALYINILYLLSAILFILGIKGLTKVKSANKGNLLSALGMFLAVITTLLMMNLGNPELNIKPGQIGWAYIIAGIIIGSLIGIIASFKVKMTSMPQMVAIFNGFGGGASAIVAVSYYLSSLINKAALQNADLITVFLSIIIGTVTFTGSMIAYAKLQGLINSEPITFKGRHILNAVLFIMAIGISARLLVDGSILSISLILIILIVIITGILGILLVISIGGADMPVVISLLNSYSGLAASATGFVLKSELLIISGALVGASGIILTNIMCKAMNRSLLNVIFGGFGKVSTESSKRHTYKNIRETSTEEAALLFDSAKRVIIIPGYGMAVAQAQHAVQELCEFLEKKGCKVSFAIHPVAGRMPGHMNVLLAEAKVPYDKLFDLDQINSEFKNTDIALIIGANDVVNPAATNNRGSPIYGMPILKAYEAKIVIVIKRSLSPGFAGIDNELFDYENTLMIFGDGKTVILDLIKEIRG